MDKKDLSTRSPSCLRQAAHSLKMTGEKERIRFGELNYYLYSASNMGLMLTLLTYPFFVEPMFNLKQQGNIWWAGYVVLLILYLICSPKRDSRTEEAEENFSYLSIARGRGADLRFVFGDGRVSLKDVKENAYDLFIIDAFNSGSIPVHLLTVEAIEEYFRVLRSNGVLLMRISNRALNLAPVIYTAADKLGLYACDKTNEGKVHPDADLTVWMALTRDNKKHQTLIINYGWAFLPDSSKTRRPWTDQYSDLISALR